ncbi:MAG: NlpC/P60 family protein [Candidatus Zixiibacteriota bacterium]
MDCSGFVRQCSLPVKPLHPGDLVFWRDGQGKTDRVGIYIGEGEWLTAPAFTAELSSNR